MSFYRGRYKLIIVRTWLMYCICHPKGEGRAVGKGISWSDDEWKTTVSRSNQLFLFAGLFTQQQMRKHTRLTIVIFYVVTLFPVVVVIFWNSSDCVGVCGVYLWKCLVIYKSNRVSCWILQFNLNNWQHDWSVCLGRRKAWVYMYVALEMIQ